MRLWTFALLAASTVPAPARADEQSCGSLLTQADSDFAHNAKAFLDALKASDKIDLPANAKQTISKKDEKGMKTILVILLKKSGEVANKTVNIVAAVDKAYDLLVSSTGPCDEISSCAQVKTQQCAARWIRDTIPSVFSHNLSKDKNCASNLMKSLLTIP